MGISSTENVARPDDESARRMARRRRSMGWAFVVMLVAAMLLPFTGYLLVSSTGGPVAGAVAQDQPPGAAFGDRDTNPRSDRWRDARQGLEGFTTSTGPYTTGHLIKNIGENWRQLRNGPIAFYGGWILVLTLLVIGLFYLFRGRLRLDHGFSGMTVERWSAAERTVHWFVAITFILLAITGLSLLFGRAVLIPVMGREAFAAFAQYAMYVHNFVGPFFVIGLLLMIAFWVKNNLPEKTDWEWLKQGGGLLIPGKHPSCGKINAGEKLLTFWTGVVVLGLVVSITGLILVFPNFGQGNNVMAVSHVLHVIAGLLWIALSFGHIYLGTLGVEGAFQGMATGRTDVNWAKQHHDLWLEETLQSGEKPQPAEGYGSATGASPGEGRTAT